MFGSSSIVESFQCKKVVLLILEENKCIHSFIQSQKSKTTPKSRQNQMSELKENKKTKVIVLYEYTTKHLLTKSHTQTSPFGSQTL